MADQAVIKTMKERVQSGGPVEAARVRKVVLESWIRSRGYGVDPDNADKSVISKSDLEERIHTRREYYNIASAFMEGLNAFIAGSGCMCTIADEEGYVLSVTGDEDILALARHNRLVEGCNRSERRLGTNAIGTALALGQPIQIFGEEHYFLPHHDWVCSGAPVFQEDGEMAGALTVIGTTERVAFHTLGMVAAAAEAVTRQLVMRSAYEELEQAQLRMEAILESTPTGLLLLSPDMCILQSNRRAAKLLEAPASKLVGKHFGEVFGKDAVSREVLARQLNDHHITVERGNHRLNFSITVRHREPGQTVLTFDRAETFHKRVNRAIGSEAHFTFEDIIGRSQTLKNAVKLAQIAAKNDSNVLLTGESGTGKELFAQAIHNAGARRDGPFVAINCGALPKSLIESELFGYEGGSFTGARKEGCAGKFELANGGTIFLDEIGDMPFDVQVALLRVLQNQEVSRVGSGKTIKIDVRVIAATNKNLVAAVNENTFRDDLYYRLNVFSIHIPSLRERLGDVPLLADYFLEKLRARSGSMAAGFSRGAYDLLSGCPWRGNIRELENAVERAVYISNGEGFITEEAFPAQLAARTAAPAEARPNPPFPPLVGPGGLSIRADERKKIEEALAASGGNVKRAAELLDISRRTLYRKLEKYGICPDEVRDSARI